MDKIVLRLCIGNNTSLLQYDVIEEFSGSVRFKDGYSLITLGLNYLEPIKHSVDANSFDIWCLCSKSDKLLALREIKGVVKDEFSNIYSKLYTLQTSALSLLNSNSNSSDSVSIITLNELLKVCDNNDLVIGVKVDDNIYLIDRFYIEKGFHLVSSALGNIEMLGKSCKVPSTTREFSQSLHSHLKEHYCDFAHMEVFFGVSSRFKFNITDDTLLIELL